jgi:hypothetical protein
MAGTHDRPPTEEARMRYLFIALLCLVTLEACSSSTSQGGRTGSVSYGKIGGGGGSGR